MKLLFVCSRNQWRSPTAEAIYRNESGVEVRSAGTAASARIKLSAKMLDWADLVFVMEKKHKQHIMAKFGMQLQGKLIVLDIQDDYQYMDPELIEEIKAGVAPYL